jgi:hypothetical protein
MQATVEGNLERVMGSRLGRMPRGAQEPNQIHSPDLPRARSDLRIQRFLLQTIMADSAALSRSAVPVPKNPRKRFVGSKSSKPTRSGSVVPIANQVPQDILADTQLNEAIKQLPSNYSFEIQKTVHHVRKNGATMVALQMPEGLQMFACTIADIIERCVCVRKAEVKVHLANAAHGVDSLKLSLSSWAM